MYICKLTAFNLSLWNILVFSYTYCTYFATPSDRDGPLLITLITVQGASWGAVSQNNSGIYPSIHPSTLTYGQIRLAHVFKKHKKQPVFFFFTFIITFLINELFRWEAESTSSAFEEKIFHNQFVWHQQLVQGVTWPSPDTLNMGEFTLEKWFIRFSPALTVKSIESGNDLTQLKVTSSRLKLQGIICLSNVDLYSQALKKNNPQKHYAPSCRWHSCSVKRNWSVAA